MARPTTPRLSRAIIAQAAIEMVGSGLELQIAPLAGRLSVRPSSLYNHVAGRADLIHAMRELLTSSAQTAGSSATDWRTRLQEELTCFWEIYAEHPRVLPLLIGVTVDEPDILKFYRRMAEALIDAGLAEALIPTTVAVLDAFALGAALDALSPEVIFSPGDEMDQAARLLANQPGGDERGRLVFETGLGYLIDGIAARAGSPA